MRVTFIAGLGLRAGCALLLLSLGCASVHYETQKLLGRDKRDILVNRIDQGLQTQQDALRQLEKTFDALQALVAYEGDDLGGVHRKVMAEFERAENRAQRVRDRIVGAEVVADDLFKEWEYENVQIADPELRSGSRAEMAETRERYERVIAAMKRASEQNDPVLTALRDRTLFLKHDLSLEALASLRDDLPRIEADLTTLARETDALQDEVAQYLEASGA